MSLRFICGGSGSGKSTYCINDIKHSLEENCEGKLILIVPDQFSFYSEKKLINEIGEKKSLKAQVISFNRMASLVNNEVGGITKVHINAAGRSIIIHKALQEVRGELKYFGIAAKQNGFINTVSNMLSEFKRYNISKELLLKLEDEVKEEDLKNKIMDLYLIYSKFEELLQVNYIVPEDDLIILGNKLDKSKFFDKADIWIDEFSTFTPQQYLIVEKLFKKANRVSVTLSAGDMFLTSRKTEEKLIELVSRNSISLEAPVKLTNKPYYRFKECAELQHLEENLFSYPNKKYEMDNSQISIFKAINQFSEVEELARNILELCRDNKYRYNQIAVILGDTSSYSKLVKVIFNQYGIPFFIDEKRDLARNPVLILLNSIMDIFIYNWSYEAVFACLKTGLIKGSRGDIDKLENIALSKGAWGNKLSEESLLAPIRKLQLEIKGKRTVKEYCEKIYYTLVELDVPGTLNQWVEDFKALGDYEKVSEYSQVWSITMDLLDQLVAVMGEEEIGLDEFAKLLSTGMNEYKVGLIPSSLDQVVVGSMERVRTHQVKALFILGVNDGMFPKIADTEGILSDRDRISLNSYGMEIAQDTKARALEDDFLIYSTLTIPSDYLRISYSVCDFEGKALRPSMIINRLKKIFPKLVEQSDLFRDHRLQYVSAPAPTFNELLTNIRENSEAQDLWGDIYYWYYDNEQWNGKLKMALEGVNYTNQVKALNAQKVKNLYGSQREYSVSRLEKYVECPFSYFVKYGLKAKERKEYTLTAPDLGSLMHEVIDEFSSYLEFNEMNWRELEKEKCEKIVSSIVESTVNKNEGSILTSSPRYKYFVSKINRMLNKSIWTISQHIKSGSFNAAFHEVEFGSKGEFPPITLELASGEKVSLMGRIDRVDKLETEQGTYIRIIDYKSGTKNFNLADVYYGLQLQLLVYLDAIITNWEQYMDSKAIPGAILYFKIDDPIISFQQGHSEEEIQREIEKRFKMQGLLLKDVNLIKEMDNNMGKYSLIIPAQIKSDGELSSTSSVASLEQFKVLKDHVRKTVISICEEMLAGDISISPCKRKEYTACTYCEYISICKFDLGIKDNEYNILLDKSEDEIWELMR